MRIAYLFTLLSLIPFKSLVADLVTLDAGNIIAQIDDWGFVNDLAWPKGDTQQNRIYLIKPGMAYDRSTTWTTWRYTSQEITFEGFFENTERADQEYRKLNYMKLSNNEIRVRSAFRAFKSTARANELEIVYEFGNTTGKTYEDLTMGVLIDLWVPFTYNYTIVNGELVVTSAENSGAKYDSSKNMFWFGYEQEKVFYAVLFSPESSLNVNTAWLKDYSVTSWNPNYSISTESTIPPSQIDMTNITDPVVYFSIKDSSFDLLEKHYIKVVLAFAETEEELVGSVNRILNASKPSQNVGNFFQQNQTEGTPPQISGGGGGGGCYLPLENNFSMKKYIKQRFNKSKATSSKPETNSQND